jgi:hypothetical protein
VDVLIGVAFIVSAAPFRVVREANHHSERLRLMVVVSGNSYIVGLKEPMLMKCLRWRSAGSLGRTGVLDVVAVMRVSVLARRSMASVQRTV